ncbi:uncharacterized protein LOC141640752 [Silene latifolia]|uniref:uncharacterized protein LOC141640752 n=1 Tax=Silene latifolia TaxID=37657 RepID=UPI003D774B9D
MEVEDDIDEDYYCSDGEDNSNSDDSAIVEEQEIEELDDNEVVHPFDVGLSVGVNEEDEEDNEQSLKMYKNGRMYTPARWGQIVLNPWIMFMSKGEFLSVLSDYYVQEGFSVIVLKSDKRRYTAECSEKLCTWKLHSSCLPDSITWAIKTLTGNHKECFNLKRNPMVTVPWMAKKIETELRAHPEMPVKSMADLLMKGYDIDVCLRTIYKVRIDVVEVVYEGFEESYNSLAAYGEVIKQTNPGSWALITWHNPQTGQTGGPWVFERFCGKENTESWSYFFRKLRLGFQSVGCSNWDWTFISDKMKGVEMALEKEFPQCTKRICAQHLYSNFKLKWGGPAFHDLFWRTANATSTHAFHKAIEEINKLSRPASDYLLSVEEQ